MRRARLGAPVPACSKCPQPAVLWMRYAGTHLCREHFLDSFLRRVKAELRTQGHLPPGTTAVALSGGKDSVSLLHCLRALTAADPRIHLVAVTVDEGIAGYRDSSLELCRQVTTEWGIPWHVVRTRDVSGYTIDAYAAGEAGPDASGRPRPACGACGVYRRVGINQAARAAGAQAVATGHNLDDQAQTVLMNVLRGDWERLARLAPHAPAPHAPAPVPGAPQEPGDGVGRMVPRLLPLRTIPEKEVLLYAVLNGLPIHDEAECPYAARSHRFALRDVLAGLEERTPGTRHALVKGHERVKPILLAGLPAVGAGRCAVCGEATTGTVCKACQLAA